MGVCKDRSVAAGRSVEMSFVINELGEFFAVVHRHSPSRDRIRSLGKGTKRGLLWHAAIFLSLFGFRELSMEESHFMG